jgi:hypothetical protein
MRERKREPNSWAQCRPRRWLEAYADGLDEVVLVPATAGDPGGDRTLTALAELASPAAPT